MGKISRPRYNKKRKRYQTNKTGNKTKFTQGYYKPVNEEKYKQPMDKTMNSSIYPEYRSSWELKFYKFLDSSDLVEYWTTEPFPIPYISPKDGQIHRYFPDVLLKLTNGKKLLIEIKPNNQKSNPINIAKWEAAKEFCKLHNLEFRVFSEDELKI
jgi:hypothetical protein